MSLGATAFAIVVVFQASSQSPEEVKKLIAQLSDKDIIVRVAAATRLIEAGPAVIPEVKAAAANANKSDVPAFSHLLYELEIRQEIDKLMADFDSPIFKVRKQVEAELESLSIRAIPALNRTMQSDDLSVRMRAEALLKKISQGK